MNTHKVIYVESPAEISPAALVLMAALMEFRDAKEIRAFPSAVPGKTRVRIPAGDFVVGREGWIYQSEYSFLGSSDRPATLEQVDPDGKYMEVYSRRHGTVMKEDRSLPATYALLELAGLGIEGVRMAVSLIRVLYAAHPELMNQPFYTAASHPVVLREMATDELELLRSMASAHA